METQVEYNAGKAEKTQKKDRIYVFTDKFVCENCKDWYEHIDPLDSPDCNECDPLDFPHLSRQETIERMGKKMYRAVWGNMRYNKFDKDRFEKLAEAALNALLEE